MTNDDYDDNDDSGRLCSDMPLSRLVGYGCAGQVNLLPRKKARYGAKSWQGCMINMHGPLCSDRGGIGVPDRVPPKL